MEILVKNIDIITVDEKKKILSNSCIFIKNGIIIFIGSEGDIPKDLNAQKVIDGKNRVAMPGLVNAHTHSSMVLLRNFADDLALEDWLFNHIFLAEAKLSDEDIYWGTMLGIAEMIKSGTTMFADMYLHMEEVARAVAEAGIRANLSKSPLSFNRDGKSISSNDTESFIEFHKKWNNTSNGRLKVSLEVHSTYLFNKNTLKDAAELAKTVGTGIQIHILETENERKESISKYGMSSAEICHDTGIFNVPVIAAHCVYLSDKDMEILKLKGVSVAHNPTSNLKLGSGIAKIPEMLERGINIALGTDGAASNNNLNMFEEMHLAALLHKGVNRNPTLMSAEQIIRMATKNGAIATGVGNEVGVIREGMKADIIILDFDKTHLCPVNDQISSIVYSAQASDVETVIIDGNIVMEKGKLTTIDEELVKSKVIGIAKRVLSK